MSAGIAVVASTGLYILSSRGRHLCVAGPAGPTNTGLRAGGGCWAAYFGGGGWCGKVVEDDDIGLPFCFSAKCPQLEFVDVSVTKDPSLLLHPIYSPFDWRILENQTKTWVWEGSSLCPETSTKNAVHRIPSQNRGQCERIAKMPILLGLESGKKGIASENMTMYLTGWKVC